MFPRFVQIVSVKFTKLYKSLGSSERSFRLGRSNYKKKPDL